jgi:flavin reductase (DIM6/NTAB) family NADH-FMN oxidoreductase RutF
MKRLPVRLDRLAVKPMFLWGSRHLLLTSGDFAQGSFNAMTIGWGSLGVMWSRPFVQVVVRPVRYTYEFMERYDTFTVCAFAARRAKALELLGTKSGRDGDKIAESGLHPMASMKVAAPSYVEAELALECRKIYWDDIERAHFLDAGLEEKYPRKDYHRIYYGEIVAAFGIPRYKATSR